MDMAADVSADIALHCMLKILMPYHSHPTARAAYRSLPCIHIPLAATALPDQLLDLWTQAEFSISKIQSGRHIVYSQQQSACITDSFNGNSRWCWHGTWIDVSLRWLSCVVDART